MRVVVDTNVFVSSFFGGHPKAIIDLWKEGRIVFCLTNAIIDEYIEVIARMGLAGAKELGELLSVFRTGHNCVFTLQTPSITVAADPDDNKFIEAAVALDAEVIISGDKHLKKIKRYAGINVFAPKDFLDRYHII
jgi:putative PIN family toxin of toxin-antitoxin system